ncbi:MAG: hypothetical protein M1531_03960 [Chloroflexi bacterium]|nr:hypothetical protein [Chloroflexota bacterium]
MRVLMVLALSVSMLVMAPLPIQAFGLELGAKSPSAITPEDLLAAALSPEDVQGLFSNPDQWWPTFPEFNVGFNADPAGRRPGERFYIARSYQLVSDQNAARVVTTLIAFGGAEQAADAFAAWQDTLDNGGDIVEGTPIGDESRYFTRANPGSDYPYEATVRYRVGSVIGRISVLSADAYETPDTLSSYATPVVQRIAALLDGSLVASPLPKGIADRMPPISAGPGPILGSAVVPAESWAVVDTSDKPSLVANQLRSRGAAELGFRRYALSADPDRVVEVVMFPFVDKQGASDWVQQFIKLASKQGTLNAGKTGEQSAMTKDKDGLYELQFAKGRVVGDVSCFAPFDADAKGAGVCEAAVRKLAESWFADLDAN